MLLDLTFETELSSRGIPTPCGWPYQLCVRRTFLQKKKANTDSSFRFMRKFIAATNSYSVANTNNN